MPLAQVWTHWELNWISFWTQFLQFVWIPSNKIHLKIDIFHKFSSENCEIKSSKSDLPRALQQHQECPQISIISSVLIWFNFHWENDSTTKSFHTITPNSLKPRQCAPPLMESFPYISRVQHEAPWFSAWQNKTNYLAS